MNPASNPNQTKSAVLTPQRPQLAAATRASEPALPFLNADGSKKRCTWLEQLNK